MKKVYAIASLLLAAASILHAAETELQAPVKSIAIFKNRVVAINRVAENIPTDSFTLSGEFKPLSGSFWLAPADAFTVARVSRMKNIDNFIPSANIVEAYAGQEINVCLNSRDQSAPAQFEGTVMASDDKTTIGAWLFLQTESGIVRIKTNDISFITSQDFNRATEEKRDVLLFTPREKPADKLQISYLTNDMGWESAYRIDLLDKQKMKIEFSGTIDNQLEDFENAEVNLVAGYANFESAGKFSPLSIIRGQQSRHSLGVSSNANQMVSKYEFKTQASYDLSSPINMNPYLSEDIKYFSAGTISMKKGDALYLPLASAECEYENLVEYKIPDRRTPDGKYDYNYYSRQPNVDDAVNQDIWEVIRFVNPFKDPITTSPVKVVQGDNVLGQSKTNWVNPGQRTSIRLTKALSVSGKHIEYEVTPPKGESTSSVKSTPSRETVYYMGYPHWKTEVAGQVILKNHRSTDAKVAVSINFSGNLLTADDGYAIDIGERGVYSVNPYNQLKWEVYLAPGEEKILNYTYLVMVRY